MKEDNLGNSNMDSIVNLLSSPRIVRTQSSDPTIKHLCERIDKGRLKPQADFQRKYVWQDNNILKSRLIESVFLEVPIPTIYTSEEDDGTEVVIDGQQRLLTFHKFLRNEFRLRGLTVLPALNHNNYQALGDINPAIQEKIDNYPLRVIKMLKDSDSSVRFDIFERLNRGSVKLNDQELRNCIYRGSFNDFLKKISQDKDFQLLLGDREHIRFQDIEYALRFFAIYELTHLKYKSPMKQFLNKFMKDYQNIDEINIEEFRRVFKQSVNLVKSIFGKNAFYLYTNKDGRSGKQDKVINQGLFDLLLYGFTEYEQNQVMPYKDSLKEELLWLMTNDDEFVGSISGAGTGSKIKFAKKMEIWLLSLKNIIGSPRIEPRCFSWEIKKQLWEGNPVCLICGQQIESLVDAEVDHIDFYWRGGKSIPENARLTHRFCNRSRKEEISSKNMTLLRKASNLEVDNDALTNIENNLRDKIHAMLSDEKDDYWDNFIPENIRYKIDERVRTEIVKFPYLKSNYEKCENKLKLCDIFDYLKIIKFNWNMFAEYFGSKRETEKHFNSWVQYRNAVKHGRDIDPIEKKTGEAGMEWISNILNYINQEEEE